MPRTTDAREKAITTAERLFREQGYAATGLTQIIAESGSPKGSFYFHFPAGKRELALAVLAAYRARTSAGFRLLAARSAGDPDAFVRSVVRAVTGEMSASGWTLGCVAQALAQELAPGDAEVADEVAALFDEWRRIIASGLRPDAADDPAARDDALALVAALEGARTLARAQRSAEPFEAVLRRWRSADR